MVFRFLVIGPCRQNTECCPKTLPSADRELYRVLTEHFYRVLSENFYRVLSENFYRVSSENFYRVPTENFIPSALRELKVSAVTKGSPNCTQAQPFDFFGEMRNGTKLDEMR